MSNARPLVIAAAGLGALAASRFLGPLGAAVGAAAAVALRDDAALAGILGAGAVLGLLLPATTASGLRPAPGVAMTVWTGDDLLTAWRRQRDAFVLVQPQIALLHVSIGGGAQAAQVADELRAAVPGVRLWTQISADPAMTSGARSALDTAHRVVVASSSEAVCWNGERAYKAAGGADVARAIVEGWKPTGVPQLQSAYSSPTGHHDYPWAAWLLDGCMGSLCQDYPFSDAVRSGTQPYGTLMRRVELGRAGWATAVADGLISPGVARGTYIPGAHLEARDVEDATQGSPYVVVWPWHGRYDATVLAGLQGVRARY